MKRKNLKTNNSEKLFAFVVFTIACIFGLIYAMNPNVFSSLVINRGYKAAGTVPDHTKGLIANGDGTYKLSLDVKGEAEKKTPKVNVIVIVDRSGSMGDKVVTYRYNATNSTDSGLYGLVDGEYVPLTRQWSFNGYLFYYNNTRYNGQRYRREEVTSNETRMDSTKTAVNSLASTLLAYNGKDGNPSDTVEMALVTFATTAQTTLGETTSSTTFTNAVNNISVATGNAAGTNWEAALKQANTISFGSNDNDPTFVIFFSDGAPTFYDRNNGGTNGTGHEEEPNMANSYNAATDDANTLATKVGTNNFYTIFAFGKDYGATYMTNLTTAAGAPSGNNYSASDTTALQNAFNDILTKIEMAGIANATINDGTTHNVKTTSGQIANLLEVDEDSFKYYKDDVEWITAPKATFNKTTGEVEWDLSSLGVLENGVTYKVTFDVYPSQYTYDIVSEIKNGDLTWLSLDENVRKYLDANGNLMTNTSATLHYKDTRVGDQPKTADYTNPKPVETEFFKIGAKKNWVNLLDDKVQNDKDLILTVTRDGEEFHEVTLNKNNNYTIDATSASAIHIAPGLMKIVLDESTNNKSIRILDAGHDYTFKELDGDYYNWDIKTETVHPMIIDGQLKDLVLVDENLLNEHPEYAIPSAMGDNTYYQADENSLEYVKINGKTYIIRSNKAITIDATNNRRSNLNIVKKVDGEDAPADAKFDFSITVTDPGIGNDSIYLTVFDTNDCDAATGLCKVIDLDDVDGWTKEPGTNWSGYYYAPSGTAFNVQLQDGWNVLVTNLTDEATYVVTEGDEDGNLPANFVFDASKSSVTANNRNGDITNPALVYTIGDQTISGSIDRDNASYTVEVTNVYQLVDIEVNKKWEDHDNQDGKRGNGAEFYLYADGTKVNGQTATIATDGTVSFTGLPRFNGKKEIKYTVVEKAMDGYETTPAAALTTGVEDGGTITNTHEPATTSLTVKKTWSDSNNQDGKRNTVNGKITLYDNNGKVELEDQDTTVDVSTSDNWSMTWNNLPVYNGGQPIIYYVEETYNTNSGYSKSGDGRANGITASEKDNLGTITVTNEYSPETTSVSVAKSWEDNNNQDGKRPKTVTFKLSNDDTITLDGTADKDGEDKAWVATFKNLPKYENGQEIEYTVVESSSDSNYTVSYGTNGEKYAVDGGTITNTHTPETTEVSVTKKWNDNNNQDGKRPKTVTFKLSNDDTITLDGTADKDGEDKAWVATFKNLPKYENGQEIEYTVVESSSDSNYTVSYGTNGEKYAVDGGTITNTHEPATTSITVTKTWNDNDDQDGYRSKVNAQVQLWQMVDGTKSAVSGKVATVPTTDGRVTVFEGLPVYKDGKQITYYVEETMDKVDGNDVYNITGVETELLAKEGNSGTIAITNEHTPDTVNIKGYKKWFDADNQDGMRPSKLIINVHSDDPEAKDPIKTVEIFGTNDGDSLNVWSYIVEGLPRYRNQGIPNVYTVTEEYPKEPADADYKYSEEYSFKYDEKDNYILINTHETKSTEVEVTKKWSDEDDQDGLRPNSIYLTLYADGEVVDGYEKVEVKPDDKMTSPWTYSFTGLDMYSNGQKIVYTVAEVPNEEGDEPVPGYSANIVYSNNNYSVEITNTHTPSKITIKGTKVWDDDEDEAVMRPDYINVRLTKNGEETDIVKEVTADSEDNWSFTFNNLDEFEDHGTPIVYGVIEEYPEDYEFTDLYKVNISGITKETNGEVTTEEENDNENNYIVTVTNKYVPEYVSISINKIWDDENDNDGMRPKYIVVNLLADGVVIKSERVTADSNWGVSFTELPKYQNHKAVVYTITEDVVDNYKSTIEVNADNTVITITNKHDPEKTKISGQKTWQDDEKNLEKRPSTITIKIYADGVYLQTITVSNQTNWKYLIENLYKYKDGKEITYTIVEDEVEDYTSVVNGYNITNYFTGGTGEVVPPNTSVDVNTGNYIIDNSANLVYVFLVTILLGAFRRYIKYNN